MKLSEYIIELQRLLEMDGDLELESLTMNEERCSVKFFNDKHFYDFNEYRKE